MRPDAVSVDLWVPALALLAVGAAVLTQADGWVTEWLGGAVCIAGGLCACAWNERRLERGRA